VLIPVSKIVAKKEISFSFGQIREWVNLKIRGGEINFTIQNAFCHAQIGGEI
jgi:hypothetical protein